MTALIENFLIFRAIFSPIRTKKSCIPLGEAVDSRADVFWRLCREVVPAVERKLDEVPCDQDRDGTNPPFVAKIQKN
eukprot:1996922-Amphidinium_carterae.1